MKRRLGFLAALAAVLLAAAAPAGAQTGTAAFTDTYLAYNSFGSCSMRMNIIGQEPTDGQRHPVFVYMHGYTGDNAPDDYKIMIQEAAAKGYVAVSPRYTSFFTLTVRAADQHAKCVYGSGPESALTKVCARPTADCSKGIVVSGLSLGSTISARAANYNANIRAAYLLGFTGPMNNQLLFNPGGSRMLPNDRVRLTFGRQDIIAGNFTTVNALTGKSCTGTNNCLSADGSGWYSVQDNEVFDKRADHCFHFYRFGCFGQEAPFDPGWRPPSTLPWALDPALEWGLTLTS